MTINCEHYNPTELAKDQWAYASTTCLTVGTLPAEVEIAGMASTTGGFTYGEIVISFFISLLVVFTALKILFKI